MEQTLQEQADALKAAAPAIMAQINGAKEQGAAQYPDPPPPPEQPRGWFDDCEVAVASDLPIRRVEFTMLGQECFVEVRVMDDEAAGRVDAAGQKNVLDIEQLRRGQLDAVESRQNLHEKRLELFLGAVYDLQFPQRKPVSEAQGGGYVPELTILGPLGKSGSMDRRNRRFHFERLEPKFAQRLCDLCCEVNHRDPLTLESFQPTSATG